MRPFQLITNNVRLQEILGAVSLTDVTKLLGIFTLTFSPGIDAVKFRFTTLKFFFCLFIYFYKYGREVISSRLI